MRQITSNSLEGGKGMWHLVSRGRYEVEFRVGGGGGFQHFTFLRKWGVGLGCGWAWVRVRAFLLLDVCR